MDEKSINDLGFKVIGAAYEVRRHLGRFLFENAYEKALCVELRSQGICCEAQVYFPVFYKGVELDNSFRVDILVEGVLPLELKALPYMGAKEVSQLMSYLTFENFKLGYLINFGAQDFTASRLTEDMYLDKGIYRLVNTKYSE